MSWHLFPKKPKPVPDAAAKNRQLESPMNVTEWLHEQARKDLPEPGHSSAVPERLLRKYEEKNRDGHAR
jgi:hypothetical protein